MKTILYTFQGTRLSAEVEVRPGDLPPHALFMGSPLRCFTRVNDQKYLECRCAPATNISRKVGPNWQRHLPTVRSRNSRMAMIAELVEEGGCFGFKIWTPPSCAGIQVLLYDSIPKWKTRTAARDTAYVVGRAYWPKATVTVTNCF